MQEQQYTGIVAKLTTLQKRLGRIASSQGVLKTFGLALVLFGVLIGLTQLTWPSNGARLIADLIFVALFGLAVYFWAVRPYFNRPSFLQIARKLEQKYGKLQSRLIAALELHELAQKNREGYSIELIEKTIEEAGGVIAEIDTEAIIDYRPLNSWLIRVGALLSAALAIFLMNPTAIYNTWLLYSQPTADFERPPDFKLSLSPDGGEFYRNMDLVIKADAEGKAPRRIDLHYKFDDGTWTNDRMSRADSNAEASFVYTFKKIKRSLDIYAKSGGVESPKAHLEIIDPPRLTDINLSFDFPDYTGLADARGNPNDGNISALKGTRVKLEARSNKPLSQSYQLFNDSSRVPLSTDNDLITGGFTVKSTGRYTVILHDEAGRHNPEPIWYDIQALEDYPPSIAIQFPDADVDLGEQMILPLEIGIADDYGFGKLNLVHWMLSEGQQTEPVKESLSIRDKKELDQTISYELNVQTLNPLPGDIIYYYCEVSDNDIVSGPKWAKTRTYSARLPNLDEILADVQGAQEEQMESLEEAMKKQTELQKQIEQISRDMLKATEVNWEKQRQAKAVLEKQKDLAEKLDDLAKEMQDNLEKLEENKLISEELAEKMQEIQNLMEEVAPPELKEAMKKLQEALEKMDPNELKKALEQFQMTSEQLLENLDRTLSLLQKLAIEQKMDMLVQLAEKITKDQQAINESTDAAADSAALAKQLQPEKNASNEFDILKDQFAQLEQMDQKEQMIPAQEKKEAGEQVNNPEIPQDFQDMQQGMCSGSKGMCKNKGKKLHKELDEMTMALKNAQKAMQDQQRQEIARKMQKAAQDLLYLSGRQETLLDSTRAYQSTGDGLRKMASNQMQIAGASSRTAELISELSKESIFINITLMKFLGMTLSDMSDATSHLDKRSAQGAIQSEQSAMANLNKTVYLLFQARENAMSSSSGSGMQEMMQQMQQMAQMQAGINEQTMMQIPQPGMQMNMGRQQALQKLAAEQEMLRQTLEEMNDQFGKRGEMLGRLDQLGEEMKKVAEDLKRQRVNQETINRQQGILSRLLEAQKSVNRRDYSKKRQAELGADVVRRSPSLPDELNGDDAWISEMIRKALDENYPRQYEKLIRAYFKSIQNQGGRIEE